MLQLNSNRKLRRVYVVFIVLTAVNLFIFFNRDFFAYVPYASYRNLYTDKSTSVEPWLKENSEFSEIIYTEGSNVLSKVIKENVSNSDSLATQIANTLFSLFHKRLGRPSQLISNAAPLDQFKLLNRYEDEKLWCGNFASMFAFFCWSKRIPCRIIEVVNDTGHHVVNEYYSYRNQKWVFVDAMNNLVQQRDGQRHLYNLINILSGVPKNSNVDFEVNNNMYSTWYKRYYNPDNKYFYYKNLNKSQVYSFKEKVKRYFFPVSWYWIYTEREYGNIRYFIKTGVFLICLFVFFYICKINLEKVFYSLLNVNGM